MAAPSQGVVVYKSPCPSYLVRVSCILKRFCCYRGSRRLRDRQRLFLRSFVCLSVEQLEHLWLVLIELSGSITREKDTV